MLAIFFSASEYAYNMLRFFRYFSLNMLIVVMLIKKIRCKHFGDPWTSEIKHRLNNCVDLVAEEARYHEQCRYKFFLNLTQEILLKLNLT